MSVAAATIEHVILFVLIICALFISAGFSVWAVVRTPDDLQGREPRRLRSFRGYARAALLAAIGAMLICLVLPEAVFAVSFLWCSLLALLAGVALAVAVYLRKNVESIDPAPETVADLVTGVTRRWARQLLLFCRATGDALRAKPGSWRELSLPFKAMDRILAFGTFARAYVGILVAAVVLSVLGVFISLASMTDNPGVAVKAMVGYNALFLVSIFTVASLAVVTFMLTLRYLGGAHFPISMTAALKTLAACVGYGTLAGVIGAALSPLTSMLLRPATTTFSGALLPSVLVDLPACGAVAGYVVGLILAVCWLGQDSTNQYYRYFFAPALFATAITCAHALGLTPEFLFHQIITREVDLTKISASICVDSESSTELQNHLSDPTWLMAVGAHCGRPAVLKGEYLTGCIAASVLILAFLAWVRQLWTNIRRSEASTVSQLVEVSGPS